MSRRFQAVLFDLDDTLYSRRAAFARWTDGYLADTLRLSDPVEAASVRALIHSLDLNGYGSKQAIFERLHADYPALPGSPARSLETFFAEFLTHVRPESATERLLDALAAASLPFGVVTNGSHRQWRKLDALGLSARTDCLFVSEDFGTKKPDPAIFRAAAAHLGIAPGHILFVGDNPAADVGGTQAVGMAAAWLHRDQPWPDEMDRRPEFVIDTLADVADILEIDGLEMAGGGTG